MRNRGHRFGGRSEGQRGEDSSDRIPDHGVAVGREYELHGVPVDQKNREHPISSVVRDKFGRPLIFKQALAAHDTANAFNHMAEGGYYCVPVFFKTSMIKEWHQASIFSVCDFHEAQEEVLSPLNRAKQDFISFMGRYYENFHRKSSDKIMSGEKAFATPFQKSVINIKWALKILHQGIDELVTMEWRNNLCIDIGK